MNWPRWLRSCCGSGPRASQADLLDGVLDDLGELALRLDDAEQKIKELEASQKAVFRALTELEAKTHFASRTLKDTW